MKQKALKISTKTLFIYKSVKSVNLQFVTETTDTTSMATTMTNTTGFNR